ncbi:MAG: hypothetical protein M1814_003712 [Vezdaea aestivalis]|nr:MAG: hypothetical protein M1814_003712 [Vezdaea aestivalis]
MATDSVIDTPVSRDRPSHKRSTSSVLKSIINPLTHKRNASHGAALANRAFDDNYGINKSSKPGAALPLGESHHNKHSSPPETGAASKGLYAQSSSHKKTLSAVSLVSLVSKEDKGKKGRNRSKTTSGGTAVSVQKPPKKQKSQTGLGALFSRPKSSKGDPFMEGRDKENEGPPKSAHADPPPIWAQFATTGVPAAGEKPQFEPSLHSVRDLDDEISLYTPSVYGVNQQRNFHNFAQPSLSRRPSAANQERSRAADRPHSVQIPTSASSSTFREALNGARKFSNERIYPSIASRERYGHHRKSSDVSNVSRHSESSGHNHNPEIAALSSVPREKLTIAKRGARVMAAVAAFNNKSKAVEPNVHESIDIDAAFEALLDSRNTPAETKAKMLNLNSKIKLDLVNQDKAGQGPQSAEVLSPSRKTEKSSKTQNTFTDPTKHGNGRSPNKRERPRSKTFSLHKNDRSESPSKRQKSSETKTSELTTRSTTTFKAGMASPTKGSGIASIPKYKGPERFVSYLQSICRPETVEIGKIQELKLSLRAERVEWVDEFVRSGGMTDLIGLLHRTIEVEWREEHEDQLMHEVLLCLKALCTTASAMHHLAGSQDKLFKSLLEMLFDDERKGPSEFTTRGHIICIMFASKLTRKVQFLSRSAPDDLEKWANIMLHHLHDPNSKEDTLTFITSMHLARPYRRWCREFTNITKEVFWIFLHNVNVISVVPPSNPEGSYMQNYFPKAQPPVPAAPHVGGIEWEAMNYLADHLDLLNGIMAGLPTVEERNRLRQELKISGFEKTMGVSLRTCKEKFYPRIHGGLRTWVAAAKADGWNYRDVRNGPPVEERHPSPRKAKETKTQAPKLELPKLNIDSKENEITTSNDGWML